MAREFDFIDWVRARQKPDDTVLLPASDDLAIVRFDPADQVLVGIDQVLDGVHFDSAVHAPFDIGRKVMNRNLSDCAAMACLPATAVLSMALPKGLPVEFAQQLYLGMESAGEAFGCRIIGGDTGAWDQKLALSVAIVGRSAGITPVRRSGAKVGDAIYVTGPLGGSILGRHLSFTPRVREARELAARHAIHAMIDISDGLSRDLAHICRESGVGAVLDASLIPVHEDARKLPGDPLDHALNDGEDHELCFTAAPGLAGAIRIGVVTEGAEIRMDRAGQRVLLGKQGFEHQF